MKRKTVVGVVACIVVLVAFAAFFVRRAARGQCEAYVREFETPHGDQTLPYEQAIARWDHLRARAEEGAATCKGLGMQKETEALERVKAEVERQKAAGEEIARKARADEVRAEAERTWPQRQQELQTQLADATSKASAGKWLDAEGALKGAQQRLDEMKGTNVEGTAPYAALAKQADTLRRRVAPHAEAIHAKAQAVRAQQTATEALLGDEPIADLDGCCLSCRQHVEDRMHDPTSFECVSSSPPRADGARWQVDMSYRGKNAFGARVLNRGRFYLQRDQVVEMKAL